MNSSQAFDSWFLRAGRRLFPYRLWVGLAFVPAGALLFQPDSLMANHAAWRIALSSVVILAGLALRAWAGGCAGDHTRTPSLEAPRLATGGPYAYVRNPIYLGTVIIGLGMIGVLGDGRLLCLHALVSALFFATIVPCEEEFLRMKYSGQYEAYFRAVPRLIPNVRPWPGRREQPFFPGVVRGEGVIALILVGIYLVMHAATMWQRV